MQRCYDTDPYTHGLRNEINPSVNWFENVFHSSPAFIREAMHALHESAQGQEQKV